MNYTFLKKSTFFCAFPENKLPKYNTMDHNPYNENVLHTKRNYFLKFNSILQTLQNQISEIEYHSFTAEHTFPAITQHRITGDGLGGKKLLSWLPNSVIWSYSSAQLPCTRIRTEPSPVITWLYVRAWWC